MIIIITVTRIIIIITLIIIIYNFHLPRWVGDQGRRERICASSTQVRLKCNLRSALYWQMLNMLSTKLKAEWRRKGCRWPSKFPSSKLDYRRPGKTGKYTLLFASYKLYNQHVIFFLVIYVLFMQKTLVFNPTIILSSAPILSVLCIRLLDPARSGLTDAIVCMKCHGRAVVFDVRLFRLWLNELQL